MGYQLEQLGSAVNCVSLTNGIERALGSERARCRRLWAYYRNPMRVRAVSSGEAGSDRPYRQAQEWGLPSRITGVRSGSEIGALESAAGVARKDVVIENDIGWRVGTMGDYLFGKPLTLISGAPDEKRRAMITRLLRLVLAKNGGIVFLQQMALIGAVHGFVD